MKSRIIDFFEPILPWFRSGLLGALGVAALEFVLFVGSGISFVLGSDRLGGGLLLLCGVWMLLRGDLDTIGDGSDTRRRLLGDLLSRVGEVLLFSCIAIAFVSGMVPDAWVSRFVVVTICAIASSILVPFVHVRAESLALEYDFWAGERALRMFGMGVATLVFGAGEAGFVLFGAVSGSMLVSTCALVFCLSRLRPAQSRRTSRDTQVRLRNPTTGEFDLKRRL